MKLDPNKKYEACIAKTTLPRKWECLYLNLGTWYPVLEDRGSMMVLDLGPELGTCYTAKKDAIALGAEEHPRVVGGNWKIRQVKPRQEKICLR